MKRGVILFLSVAILTALLAWQALARERAYRRLIAAGDQALGSEQTFLALEAFSGAIALRGDSMIAHLKRGETYRRRGETAEALRDLRTAARLDPTATRPLELLGDVNAGLGRQARAAEAYEAYLRIDDRAPLVLYKLALIRFQLGQPAAALDPLRRAVAVDDRFAEGHYLLGLCHRALNEPAEAASSLERAISLAPQLTAAREALAAVYTTSRRDREALVQLEALAAAEPDRIERRIAVALGYARGGRHDMAVVALRQLAGEHPEEAQVYVAIARVWLEAAEVNRDRVALSKAFEALDAISRRTTPGSEALTLLGRAQLLAGNPAAAERSLRQATVRFPVEPAALLQLSLAAEFSGHYATARDALMRYTTLSGDGLPSLDRALHLGELSLRLNEPHAAAEWFGKAAAQPSAGPSAHLQHAEALIKAGDEDAAFAAVEQGLGKDPRNAALLTLRRRLAPGR
jgi:tetratricopeptide (TPR) repeat protein